MSYNRLELKESLLQLAQEHKPHFIDELVSLSAISRASFYRMFPKASDDYNQIVEVLTDNKVETKRQIKHRLLESSKASELIPLYKLLATEEEKRALSGQYIQQEEVRSEIDDMTDEEKRQQIKNLVLKGLGDVVLTDEEISMYRKH